MSEPPEFNAAPSTVQKQPLALWVGFYLTFVVTMLFLIAYDDLVLGLFGLVDKTTVKGWLATIAAGLEVSGVVLIASPELRPKVERVRAGSAAALSGSADALKRFGRSIEARLRLLLHRPQNVTIEAVTGSARFSAGEVSVVVKGDPTPGPAEIEKRVARLEQEVNDLDSRIGGLDERVTQDVTALHKEVAQLGEELREHTDRSVREVAEAELKMRLLGVVFVLVGIGFGWLANLAV